MSEYKESYYNVDLKKEGIINENSNKRILFNTNTRGMKIIDKDLNLIDNLQQDSLDYLFVVPKCKDEVKEYLWYREKYWVHNNKPAFEELAIIFEDMSEEVRVKTLDYIKREIERNDSLLELGIIAITKSISKREIIKIFAEIRGICECRNIDFEIKKKVFSYKNNKGCNMKNGMRCLACPFQYSRSIIINTDGGLYRCSKFIGKEYHKVGTIEDDVDIMPTNNDSLTVKCKKCKYLPMCAGGCYYESDLRDRGILCVEVKAAIGREVSNRMQGMGE